MNLKTIVAELRAMQVTVWQGKKKHDHIKDMIVIVDSKTGVIKEYRMVSQHTHDGIKNGECTPDEMYGANGFERARLVENSIVEHQNEEVL